MCVYFALPFLFSCSSIVMAAPQFRVSLASANLSKFQLTKDLVRSDLIRNGGAAGDSVKNETLRQIIIENSARRTKRHSWNSSTTTHGTSFHDKSLKSREDSSAPFSNCSTDDELNKSDLYTLLAQQEATCLQEFGKLEPAITFEFPQELFRPFVCLEGSQNFSKCEQCVQMIQEVHVGYTASQAANCQNICHTSLALPKCAERCAEFAQKLINGIQKSRQGAGAGNEELIGGRRSKLNECSLKALASEVKSTEDATSGTNKHSNITLTTNVFCESVTKPLFKSYATYSVLTTSIQRKDVSSRHFVYLKSIFSSREAGIVKRRDGPVVFVVEQRQLIVSANRSTSGPIGKWTGWTTLGKSPYGLHKIEVAYRHQTYQWRVRAIGHSGPIAVSIVKSFETLDGYMRLGPPERVYLIENKPKGSTVDVLLGWDSPKERACFHKIVLETRTKDEPVRTVRIKGEPIGVHKVWFYRLKFNYTYEVRITSRSAEWHEDESTQASFSFTTPTCLDTHHFRFDKCAPPPPRNLSCKVEAMSSSKAKGAKDAPGKPETSSKRHFTAYLLWEPPEYASNANIIQEYVVDIRAYFLDVRSSNKSYSGHKDTRSQLIEPLNLWDQTRFNFPGNVTHAKVDNLDPTLEYIVLVSAVSSKGSSRPATLTIRIHSAMRSTEIAMGFWVYSCAVLVAVLLAAFGFQAVKIISQRRKMKAARDSHFKAIDQRDTHAEDLSVVSLADDPSSTWKVLEENSFPEDKWRVSFQDLTIEDIIGKGAFGIVRKAKIRSDKYLELRNGHHDESLDTGYETCGSNNVGGNDTTTMETVALKMLRFTGTKMDEHDFMKELMAMQTLGNHPQIVTLLGVCTTSKSLYFVLEYCSGGDLLSFLRKFRERFLPLLNLTCKNVSKANFKNPDSNSLSHGKTLMRKNSLCTGEELEQVCYADLLSDISSSSPELSYELPTCTKRYDEDASVEENSKSESISEKDALSYARQVALGMAYLERNHIIHRDLACRNVLVMADRKHVKISDFGLSRDIYTRNVYRQRTEGKLPYRWMAMESISSQIFTSKSDVWSYGIVLWELVTLGAVPYPAVENQELFNLLCTGYRMERPDNCSEELYALMRKCWRIAPADRPNFTELALDVETMMDTQPELYLTFRP